MIQATSSSTGAKTATGTRPSSTETKWPEGIKCTVRVGATILVSPLLLLWWMQARLIGPDRATEYATETLAFLPGLLGRYLRRAFLGRVLVRCHPTAEIGFGVIFSKAGAVVEENVYIGPRCHIGLAHIERDVLIAAGVHVTSGSRMHGLADPTRPIREQEGVNSMVRIGAGAWIGSAAVVMADVGRDTVVGAGAVVTKPLPDGVIAVGVPARVIRVRDTEENHV
jgi:virginiamycin A acetyltransferase